MRRFILPLPLLGLDREERTNRQRIHAGALETVNGFLRCADDGLVLLEAVDAKRESVVLSQLLHLEHRAIRGHTLSQFTAAR